MWRASKGTCQIAYCKARKSKANRNLLALARRSLSVPSVHLYTKKINPELPISLTGAHLPHPLVCALGNVRYGTLAWTEQRT